MAYDYTGFGASELTTAEQKQLAKGIAAKITGKTSGKAFETAAAAADFGLSQAMLAAEHVGQTQAGSVIKATGSSAAIAYGIVTKAQKGEFKADAAGVVAVAGGVESFIGSVADVAAAAGGSARVVNSIKNWAGVATACAIGGVSMMAGGVPAIAGGLACAFSAISAALSEVFGNPIDYIPPAKPRSIFCLNAEAKQLVATDALRLVKVLRRYYGIKSFTELYNGALYPLGRFVWITKAYTPRPPLDSQGKVSSPQDPIPAHNLATILQLLDYHRCKNPHAANINVRDGYAMLACYRTGIEPAGRGMYLRYNEDNDINAESIANAAFLGRAAVGTYGTPEVAASIVTGGNTDGWPGVTGTTKINLLPFIQVDELINFFAAITDVEFSQYGPGYVGKYRFGSYNPVRFITVRHTGRTGRPDEGPGYSGQCWTNMLRAPDDCRRVDDRAAAGHHDALREYGAMRLMAAFSYLHMMWHWSSDYENLPPNEGGRKDPFILNQQQMYEDRRFADEINSPVDPRQVVQNGSRWSLRSDGGVCPDAPKTRVTRFSSIHSPWGNNTVHVNPVVGGSFAVAQAPTMRKPDVYRNSNINVARIRNSILEHNRLVERAVEEAAKGRLPTSYRVVAAMPLITPQTLIKVTQQMTRFPDWKTRFFQPPKKETGAGGPILLGAAALAALMLLK